MRRTSRNLGFTLVELLVVITIIGILIALLLPAVQTARESARKVQCTNNLKQATLAMLQHEEMYKFYPSGGWGWWWVGDPDRGPGKEQPGSWLFSILPFIEQIDLYQLGSDGNPQTWTAKQLAGSTQRIQTPLATMNCPSRRSPVVFPTGYFGGVSLTFYGANAANMFARGDYAACAGDMIEGQSSSGPSDLTQAASWTKNNTWPDVAATATGVSYLRSQVKAAMITDGLSATYMLGEKYLITDNYYNGNDPADNETMYVGYDNDNFRTTYCPVPLPANYVPTHTPMQDTPGYANYNRFGSAHPNSLNMSFCDGSVQAVSYSINAEAHRRLGNRRDDLPVDPKDF